MSIFSRVKESLDAAWVAHEQGNLVERVEPPVIDAALSLALREGGAPTRQMLITILAAESESPARHPAALQLSAGADRRSQAKPATKALTAFLADHGLTMKVSQDPGVSHPYRETVVDEAWATKRRGKNRLWANAMLQIVIWLSEATEDSDRRARAALALDRAAALLVEIAVSGALDYPRFRATPKLAMRLVHEFTAAAPDRPDATEAVVTVASRVLASALETDVTVERRDINSPDPIDVLITSENGDVRSGIEVTENQISLSKIQHEVVKAMLTLGLDRAIVVSRGVSEAERAAIDDYIARAHTHFGQQIDLVTVDVIESWLSFPGTPRSLATEFLWGVGDELDALSNNGNRQAWFDVLDAYASSIATQQASVLES